MLCCEIRKQLRDFELDIRFSIQKETLVIVGQSGCGKSTTLRAIAGLITPDHGQITIDDHVLYHKRKRIQVPPEEREIGYLFQNYALFPHLTVYENVAYGLTARKLPVHEQKRRVMEQMEQLCMTEYLDFMPDELSGGQQQRVALARALVLQPKLLLLDEPLSALDVTTRDRVRRELKKTFSQLQIPAVVVTHDYEDAISLGQRILVMDEGKIVQEGTSQELIESPRTPFVADFSGTNYFHASVVKQGQDFTQMMLTEWNQTLQSAFGGEGNLSIIIHPWDIRLTKMTPDDPALNVIACTIISILSYGNRLTVHLDGDIPLIAEVQGQQMVELMGMEEGDHVFALIDPHSVQTLGQTG